MRKSAKTIRLDNNIPKRLFGVHEAAYYLGISTSTFRDIVNARLIHPVPMHGSARRDAAGNIVAGPTDRRMRKFLFDRADLDQFVEELKNN
jgi:hypothetical protein